MDMSDQVNSIETLTTQFPHLQNWLDRTRVLHLLFQSPISKKNPSPRLILLNASSGIDRYTLWNRQRDTALPGGDTEAVKVKNSMWFKRVAALIVQEQCRLIGILGLLIVSLICLSVWSISFAQKFPEVNMLRCVKKIRRRDITNNYKATAKLHARIPWHARMRSTKWMKVIFYGNSHLICSWNTRNPVTPYLVSGKPHNQQRLKS